MASKLVRRLHAAFLVVGLGLLILLFSELDADAVADRLLEVGWLFAPAFAAYVLGLALTTMAWSETLEDGQVGFGSLFAYLWAGHAVNQVTPTATFGEVLKGSLLAGKVDSEEMVASLVIHNFLTFAVTSLFTMTGPLVALVVLDLPAGVLWGLAGAASVIGLALLIFYLLVRRGLAGRVAALLNWLPFVKLADPEKFEARAAEIDRRVRSFRKREPGSFLRAILYLLSVRLLQVLELWCYLLALLPDRSAAWLLVLALVSQTAMRLVAWATSFVPFQIGTQEGGQTLFYELLGLNPLTGFALALLRRIRRVLGISIGWIIALVLHVRRRRREERERALREAPDTPDQ